MYFKYIFIIYHLPIHLVNYSNNPVDFYIVLLIDWQRQPTD